MSRLRFPPRSGPTRWQAPRHAAQGLHLATDAAPPPDDAPPVRRSEPILHETDPRWVLARRAAEGLDGSVITPDARDRLIRLGRLLGLTPFDANLIVAIVQDQARRGTLPQYCAAAGEPQLAMVPLPTRARVQSLFSTKWTIAAMVAGFLTAETFLVWWLLR